jgi:ABC-type sugar transport system substrate-binding protein
MRKALVGVAALMLAVGPAVAQQKSVKIGFVSTKHAPSFLGRNPMMRPIWSAAR